jgi:hypothetical protein
MPRPRPADTPPPPPSARLERALRYAKVRSAELTAMDRISAVIRHELPDLPIEHADRIARLLLDDVRERLAAQLASNPTTSARALLALALAPAA